MNATLWETAPATMAVREHPSRTLTEARQKLDEWSAQVRLADALLADPLLTAGDRERLTLERSALRSCMLACANIIAACEEQMRRQAAQMRAKWGWLL